jgi:hypothetical protein
VDFPLSAEDWTLGQEQWAWLERVLAENGRTWTFVFAEHLLGGVANPKGGKRGDSIMYHYGRGGLRATIDGTLRSPFLGEQRRLQALMSERGVDLFFHAHDHVALVGEKLDADGHGEGVVYALGGQASGTGEGPNWVDLPWFRAAMDYDGDGEPDFLPGSKTGTILPGFYRVTIHGRESVDVVYVASDPVHNGSEIVQVTLRSDGSSTLLDASHRLKSNRTTAEVVPPSALDPNVGH